ncbi:MAG: 1-acyl-sn-glycerol-3-phosphate acyltransferase [Phycisphaerales bacterium]|nr:1-acyl-sn-glycerol-3-phosphate acyltransferase [Phycisphaerales bacterium]
MSFLSGRFRTGVRVPGHAWYLIFWWDFCCLMSEWWMKFFYRLRVVGRDRIPRDGPLIFLSNHQSYYDPVINGSVVAQRQYSAIASAHLFKFKPFGWLIRSFGAVPVAANAGDKGAIKAALKELEAGRCVLIYPEGSRCEDGHVAPFQRGISLLIRRSKATVVPLAIEGAFDVWPRSRAIPRLRGRVVCLVGTARTTEEIIAEGTDKAMGDMRLEIDRLRLEGRAMLRERTRGRWPLEGTGEGPTPH